MKCKNCGKDILDGAKFCVYCGTPIEEEPKSVPETAQQTTEIPPMQSVNVSETKVSVSNNVNEEVKETVVQAESQKSNEPSLQPIEEEKVQQSIVDIVAPEEPKQENIETTSEVAQPEPQPIELPKEPLKQETNIETKVVKKSSPVLIVIIFLLLAIIIGGGIFVYTNYITPSENKNSGNQNQSQSQSQETTNEVIKQDYDKEKAKELIDMYYYSYTAQPGKNLFTAEMTEEVKANIALNNLKDEFKKVECSQISGFELDASGNCVKSNTGNGSTKSTNGTTINYDTLNNKYKYLFGKEKEISKADFKDLTYFVSWEYINDKNMFLQTIGIGGLEGPSPYNIYSVKDFSQSEDKLIVNVGYAYIELETDTAFSTTIKGEKVTYTEEEIKKDTFEKEFLDKYLDKLDTYEFTFKYEDDHYVFVDMKKA